MSGFTVNVAESNEVEDELDNTISTTTLTGQRINHILGNLGPKTKQSFLIKCLLISKRAIQFHNLQRFTSYSQNIRHITVDVSYHKNSLKYHS
ncbi:hypothetical protein Hanom_Chr08g00690011 [Helianthus anomalus]